MSILQLTPGRAELESLLQGEGEYLGPQKILQGITAEDAFREVAGCPHTIASLVAHLDFWQQWTLEYTRGGDPGADPAFQMGVSDFPPVEPAGWEGLLKRFLDSFAELPNVAEDPAGMERVVFDKCNLGYLVVSHAGHNAYHLGQIVLLRCLLSRWPPAK